MIADVFVASQDNIRLILLLMYKIIIIRRHIIIGLLSNCPAISPQCRTSHTRANEDYDYRPGRLSAPILNILPIIDIGHFQNRFADYFFY